MSYQLGRDAAYSLFVDRIDKSTRESKLNCKPGYKQRGAACQPEKTRKGKKPAPRMTAAIPLIAGGLVASAGLIAAAPAIGTLEKKLKKKSEEKRIKEEIAARKQRNKERARAYREYWKNQTENEDLRRWTEAYEKRYSQGGDYESDLRGYSEFLKNKQKKRRDGMSYFEGVQSANKRMDAMTKSKCDPEAGWERRGNKCVRKKGNKDKSKSFNGRLAKAIGTTALIGAAGTAAARAATRGIGNTLVGEEETNRQMGKPFLGVF